MPQMKPLLWLFHFFYSLMIMMFIIYMMYYIYMNIFNFNMMNKKFLKIKHHWYKYW